MEPSHALWRTLARLASCLLAVVLPSMAQASPTPGNAPPSDAGLPAIRNFDPSEYGGASQNWAVTQDQQGVIYVGNVESGVLSFDGMRWRHIPTPGQTTVRSLATGPDGRIYVGTVGNLGYLAPDAAGQLRFVSLLDKIPPEARHFTDVWSIYPTSDGVYFATLSHLFRYRHGAMTVWTPKTSYHLSFLLGDTLYIREVGRGLLRLAGDQLELVPGSARFADEKIYAVLPWKGAGAQPGDLLLGTRTQGWFIKHGDSFRPWITEADAAMRQAAIYGAIWLDDGRLAVATLRGGLFLLDGDGHLLRTLNRSNGLTTNMVLALFQDRQRGLWLATNNSITRIATDSPLTVFGERSGLMGSVLALQRHAGALYAGTSDGLFRLVEHGNAHFEPVPQVQGQIWSLASVDEHLLVAGDDGLFALTAGKPGKPVAAQRVLRNATLALQRSRRLPTRVFVGYQDGIGVLRREGQRWVDEGRLAGIRSEVRTIRQDAQGRLWLSLWFGGIARIDLPPDWQGPHDPRTATVTYLGVADGLPDSQDDVVEIDGELRFITNQGIYRFDAASHRFQPDPAFAGLFPGGPRQIDALYQGRHGELWMFAAGSVSGAKETGRAVRSGKGWQWQVTPLQPIAGIGMSVFLEDPTGTVWMGGDKGIYRYQPDHPLPPAGPFRALLREVDGHDGRTLFAGPRLAGTPTIPYAQNSLRFEFAAPSYIGIDSNRYQVQLVGIDRHWSAWSGDPYRDYTNLPEGDYRFRVRARNVYGEQSTEAGFSFRILPPWYRSWWAWLLWVSCGAALLGLLSRWRSATLQRRNHKLALLVKQRTSELELANQALARQAITDPLTGLKNRRYLYDHIAQDVGAARGHTPERRQEPAADAPPRELLFLMVDIDHFKEINDSFGHAAGDRMLVQFRDILLGCLRETDTPVRWGGEEFLVLVRFVEAGSGALFAERIRAAVAAHPFSLGNGLVLRRSCSIGFASYPFCADEPGRFNWEQVVGIADECLYVAKRHGRNAWAGVQAVHDLPHGPLADALRESFARLPAAGPLRVCASWAQTECVHAP